MNYIRALFVWSGFFTLLLNPASGILAQAPTVTGLFPTGGQSGTKSVIKLQGKPGSLPLSIWVADDDLLQAELNETATELTVKIAEDAAPQLTWIRFYNASGSSELIPFIIGALPQIEEKEPNQSISEAHLIENLPQVVDGVLSKSGEIDTFAVTLNASETFIASLDAHQILGSPMDGVLQLLDHRGFVIAQNDDDHGFDPLVNFTVPEKGTYYVRLFGFPSTPNSTINYAGGADFRYRLTLTNQAFATYQVPVKNIQTTVNKTVGWNLDKLNSKPVELICPPVESNGKQPLSCPETFPATLSLPASVFGVIDRSDARPHYQASLKKGAKVRLQVLSQSLGSFLDPVLTINDSSGKLIKEFDDIAKTNFDIDTAWTAPLDETYSFFISDRYQSFSPRHYYQFRIEDDEPRFRLSLSENHFSLTPGKPLEINITVERLGGFELSIAFLVAGLPENITYESIPSEHKQSTEKKVTLKLTAAETTTIWNGPIELAGYPVGDESKRVIAVTPTILPDTTTSQLWLTLIEPTTK
ncbi:PPC domain-containing protein [Rubinisphaera sp.]|uniref:PPC domain-containing protein n=1 Tax=Rubinisphaera sp. TaxID=2024857 RepID=UPI0025D92A0E|nr:PPC domain-containing protein [Rubinisphaera sp.]|tara:strand:- start:4770 stop:6356 length:1587 start_codon:yes stop_codon:yes gene_type:complete